MNPRAQQQLQAQAEVDAWLAQNKNWDKGLPKKPDRLLPRIEVTQNTEDNPDSREKYDLRRAVPVPQVDKTGLPPLGKTRKPRTKKVFNYQSIANNESAEDRLESEDLSHEIEARRARNSAYLLSVYTGKYKAVLALRLQGKTCPEIARIVGKCGRRIQQVIHGNFSKGRKAKLGLKYFIAEVLKAGIPESFQYVPDLVVVEPVPVVVQQVHCKKKSLQKQAPIGQLGWDFEGMGVAA